MACSPDKESHHFQKSFSSHSDISIESKEEKREKRVFKGKKDQGYCFLERASSEEELVDGNVKSKSKKSGGKVFAKLKHKNKSSVGDEKSSKISQSKSAPKKQSLDVSMPQSPEKHTRQVFGLALEQAVKNNPSHDQLPIPAVVRFCMDRVNESGLKLEGIYRLSPSKSQLDELKRSIDCGLTTDDSWASVDSLCAAALFKSFLRDLPDHLLTQNLRENFEQVVENKSFRECRKDLLNLIEKLPVANKTLLAYLFAHISNVMENSEFNKMPLSNIGLILQPVLNMSQSLLTIFLQHSSELFADIKIKRYVPPIRANSTKLSMEFPNNIKDIEEEVKKQESLLDYIHDEIKTGCTDANKEEELWDVQRFITQLKRELKKLKKQHRDSPFLLSDQKETNQPMCLEMFEEKQLLAVQSELRENIELEKQAILTLYENLQALTTEQNDKVGRIVQVDEKGISDAEWLRRCEIEEKRHEDLITKIIEERNHCARLKAQIEMLQLERQESFEATRL